MKEHDYRKPARKWGWTIWEFEREDDANFARVEGFGKDLAVGDHLITGDADRETVSEIVEIKYWNNPLDFWQARVRWLAHRTP